MKIVYTEPPIMAQIVEVFGPRQLARLKPVFAWGEIIYWPGARHGEELGPELVAHEGVHGLRQLQQSPGARGDDAMLIWWDKYLKDPAFRLAEEILAHRAELAVLMVYAPGRSERRKALRTVAARMCAPLYRYPAGLINVERAKALLREVQAPRAAA